VKVGGSQDPFITVITPSMLRASLEATCASLDIQTYPLWEHIIACDVPKTDIPDYLWHPNRQFFFCPYPHRNGGSSCRRLAGRKARGRFLCYMDDDDIFHDELALERIVAAVKTFPEPFWAIAPLLICEKEIRGEPKVAQIGTPQIIHRKEYWGEPILWPDHYATAPDGVFAEYLQERFGTPARVPGPPTCTVFAPRRFETDDPRPIMRDSNQKPIQRVTFSIITPTINRKFLEICCESVESQSFDSWEHIVVCDIPGTKQPEWSVHPQRRWINCPKHHGCFGNFCRHLGGRNAAGEWIGYIDDDDFYADRDGFRRVLNAVIDLKAGQEWIVAPMLYAGELWPGEPVVGKIGTCQMFHRRKLALRSILWPAIEAYAADGIFAESLFKTYGEPARVTGRAIAAVEFHNFGLGDDYYGKTQKEKALISDVNGELRRVNKS
jgi:glycosyltransferase involved in cell wall biosynthesis